MKEIKITRKTEAREAYEPVEIKVMTITPQGVLCGSGGPAVTLWKSGSSSSGSI